MVAYYITFGFLFLFLLLVYMSYRKFVKQTKGFPFEHLLPQLVCFHLTGKIPKDVPLNSYIFKTLIDKLEEYRNEGLLMTYVTRPVLFVFGEEPMKFFLNEKAAINKPSEYAIPEEDMGAGIATSNGERWRAHRKLINPVFHIGMLKEKVPLFNQHALCLVKDLEKLAGKPCVDILGPVKRNYFNALCESVFGLKQTEEKREKNKKAFNLADNLSSKIIQRLIYPWLRPRYLLPFSSFGRSYLKMHNEFKSYISEIINDMIKLVESHNTGESNTLTISTDADRFSTHLKKSFTYVLLRQHFNDPSFTFQDVHDEVTTILLTGYNTVTYASMWCLFLLGLHPEVQEKAYEEIVDITENYASYEDTCNLTYLEAVIMETLRLFPSVPIFARTLSEDVQFDKYKVHKGTTIGFVDFISHRNPDIFPNPEHFEPERFLSPESRKTWSYVPFSEGPRICIGKKYAFIEMKIFLSHILRNFKICSLDKREDIGIVWAVDITPDKPIRMKVTSRNNNKVF